MASIIRAVLAAAAATAAICAFAPGAWAGCGDVPALRKISLTTNGQDGGSLIPVALGNLLQPPITGMWSVKFTANGSQWDWGYQVWHADGTEIMNSGGHSASTGNFCMGTWTQIGPFTYKLNHVALSYDPSGPLAAHLNIRETVTLDNNGNGFSGPFTADIYSPAGAAVGHVAGTIVGQRFTQNDH